MLFYILHLPHTYIHTHTLIYKLQFTLSKLVQIFTLYSLSPGLCMELYQMKKVSKFLVCLNNLHADIVLLQEIYTPKVGNHKFSSSQIPHAYLASHNSKQRHIAIIINKKIHFTSNNATIEPEGRFIIMSISAHNTEVFIASIYG